jgi:mitotic spindle assembly checkpoint protein MAD1
MITLETSLENCEKLRTDAVNAFERSEQKLKLAQLQSSRYEKEVKSLRALLQTFDAEFKIGKPSAEALVASKDGMIAELRVILDESRSQIKMLMEKSFDSESTSTITPQVVQSSADAVQLQNHKEEIRQLKFQLQRLKDELFGLQKATGLDYVPSQTRVLHLVQNPTAGAVKSSIGPGKKFATHIEELRHLREENKRLQELVLQRSDDIDSSDGKDHSSSSKLALDTSVAQGVNSSTIIADPEKVNQRLKETFKERITCFREAVYLLTGFKIDLISSDVGIGGHPMLRLRSMYAEDPDDCLLFRWRGLSTLELMDTPFAKKLDSRLFSILASSNSVPHFLSNVTQELFENQTFMG